MSYEEKPITLTAEDGQLVTLQPQTVSLLGGLDLKSVAFLLLRPLIVNWIQKALDNTEIKEKLKLTDQQVEDLTEYLTKQVDKIIGKVIK